MVDNRTLETVMDSIKREVDSKRRTNFELFKREIDKILNQKVDHADLKS